MKKFLTGVGAAAMAISVSANSFAEEAKKPIAIAPEVEVTGKLLGYVESDKDGNAKVSSKTSEFGIKAKHDIGNNTYVFGQISVGVDVDSSRSSSDQLSLKYGFVGIGNPTFGELSAGKTKSLMDDFTNKTDMFNIAGNSAFQKVDKQLTSSLKYTKKFGEFTVGAQAQFLNESNNVNQSKGMDLWIVGVGAYGFGATFGSNENTKEKYYGVGYGRKFGAFSLAGTYSIKENQSGGTMTDIILFDRVVPQPLTASGDPSVVRGYEVVVGYDVTSDVTVLAGYQDTDHPEMNGVATGAVQYKLGKGTTWFTNVDYKRAVKTASVNLDAETTLRTGLVFKF